MYVRKDKVRVMVLDNKVFTATNKIGEALEVEPVMYVERELGCFRRDFAQSVDDASI